LSVAANELRSFVEVENRDLLEQPLEHLVQEALSTFGSRVVQVVMAREGFATGNRMTLEQIGAVLAVTRERVRQLEAKFWGKLRDPSFPKASIRPFVRAVLCYVLARRGSLIARIDSPEAHLWRFIAKCGDIPEAEVRYGGLSVLGTNRGDIAALESRLPAGEVEATCIAGHLDAEGGLWLVDRDVMLLAQCMAQFRGQHLTKAERVCLALREIGKPAHFSTITEVYNRLFPDALSGENAVHAVLGREECGVVWIGIRGTYALEEWGYEHPSKSLFDAVAEIVEKRYEATGKPVPLAVIEAEIGKYRRVVKFSSLTIAAYSNPRLRRVSKEAFVPGSPGDRLQEEVSEDELDKALGEFEDRLGQSNGMLARAVQQPTGVHAVPKRDGRLVRLRSLLRHAVPRVRETAGPQGAGEKSFAASTSSTETAAARGERAVDVSASTIDLGEDNARRARLVPDSGRARALIRLARSKGLKVVDDRPDGGHLWIVGGKELYSFLSPRGLVWGPRGAAATNDRPGWYLCED